MNTLSVDPQVDLTPNFDDLDELVRRLTPTVRHRAERFRARGGLRGVELDDLTQEIWTILLARDRHKLRMWQPGRGLSFERFVALVADRALMSLAKHARAGKRSAPVVEFSDAYEPYHADHDTPELRALRAAELARAARTLAVLPPRGRDVLEALWLDGLTPKSAASRLGVKRQVVYNWQHRIRALLEDAATAP